MDICLQILALSFTMQQMLLAENADPELVEERGEELVELSGAILSAAAEWGKDPLRMVAIGFQESRFAYRIEGFGVDNGTACGVFQQIPHYAHPEPMSCEELFDPEVAAYALGAKLDRMESRWGEDNFGDLMCHYLNGSVCDEFGHAYAERHQRFYRWANRYFDEFQEEILESGEMYDHLLGIDVDNHYACGW